MKERLRGMKAQAMIDALMIVLTMSIVFASVSFFINPNAMKTEQLRFSNELHQRTLLAILNNEVKNGSVKGKVIDLLPILLCYGCKGDLCSSLNSSINASLKKANKGRNYIFFANSGTLLYDKQPTVCLDDVSVATIEYESECGNLSIIYGSWPDYLEPPETC